MKELFKEIKNYEGLYSVSNLGNVYSYRKNRLLNKKNCKGYLKVQLSKNGITKNFSIHRLVAEAFIENPKSLPCVNHKDENRANNCVNNLEWCDVKYNNNYGTRIHKVKQKLCKCIQMLDLYGNVIKEFESIHDANKYFNKNVNTGNISSCCLGNRNTAYGYRWKYK